MKIKKKSRKILKEAMFVQECGTYTNQILVLAGITEKQKVFRFLKKCKANVDFSKWVLTDFDFWKESVPKKQKGLFCFNSEVEGAVLILSTPNDSWEYWEILMHEVHHAVNYLADMKGMLKEIEAQAYLFEFLFHSIRRKLQNVDPIK